MRADNDRSSIESQETQGYLENEDSPSVHEKGARKAGDSSARIVGGGFCEGHPASRNSRRRLRVAHIADTRWWTDRTLLDIPLSAARPTHSPGGLLQPGPGSEVRGRSPARSWSAGTRAEVFLRPPARGDTPVGGSKFAGGGTRLRQRKPAMSWTPERRPSPDDSVRPPSRSAVDLASPPSFPRANPPILYVYDGARKNVPARPDSRHRRFHGVTSLVSSIPTVCRSFRFRPRFSSRAFRPTLRGMTRACTDRRDGTARPLWLGGEVKKTSATRLVPSHSRGWSFPRTPKQRGE
jgi:hypothetical protein